jgi:hypothetical protein
VTTATGNYALERLEVSSARCAYGPQKSESIDPMSDVAARRSNSTAWFAFWVALAGLILMPIPLFIGLILGGGLSIIAAILAVIALLKGLARSGKGIAPVVFAGIFIALTWGGISIGGGVIW